MSTTINNKENNISQYEKEDVYTYKPRNRNTNNSKNNKVSEKKDKKINKKAIIIPAAAVAVFLLAFAGYSVALPQNEVADNVYVAGVDLGKMNSKEAREAIFGVLNEDDIFTVVSGGKNAQISAEEISLKVNTDETVNNAMGVGKNSNPFKNSFDRIRLKFSKVDIPLILSYDEDALHKVLFDFGTTINGESTEPQYEFGDDYVTIIPGTPGQNHDTSAAQEEFINAVSMGKKDDIAVTLNYAQIQKLDTDTVYNELVKEPKEASYEKNDEGKIIVKEHSVGVKLDKSKLDAAVKEVNEGREAKCEAEIIKPSKTKEDLEANLFSTTLGTYTTDFSNSSANRAHNVKKASDSIDGVILMPGDSFSYNNTIGNPSLKNGYKVASVFENGKSVEGVGGGVCQVSSTLYSAVLYADLSVTERHNHSLPVAYVPKGQDATVSYGSLDFKFKNSTDYPIKISSKVNGRKLTVSIIGGKYSDNRKVELNHQLVSTIAPTEKQTEDSSLAAGTKKVVSSGKNGYVVDTYKTVYKNGSKDSSKKITRSTYKMTPSEVIIGTGTNTNIDNNTIVAPPADNSANVGTVIGMPDESSVPSSSSDETVELPEQTAQDTTENTAENN
ncbi:MAG: VanW family protein [Clostridia bacterium]|nr:VanW family protein [Clostridia bacterium]